MLAVGRMGLAETDPAELGGHVLSCWDAFLDLVTDPATDLSRPSRLPGWTGADTCIHLGSWPRSRPLDGVLASARADGAGHAGGAPDAANAALVQAYRGQGEQRIVAALVDARDRTEAFFDSPEAAALGRHVSGSPVGPLPVLSLVHAATYELAVHALDLAPCGAPPPPPVLLNRGLAALQDVTGALCARTGIRTTITAQAPEGGWSCTSGEDGWTTQPTAPGPVRGTGAAGSRRDLLDASAGRTSLGQLLLTRRLVVHDLPSFLQLAPLLQQVPGLPGGPALRGAVAGLGRVTRALRLTG